MKEAIQYFKKASNERNLNNSSIFCSFFYHFFGVIIFKKSTSNKEIDGYIAAAKKEIGHSKSKQNLLEAVEQLAALLETAQNAQEVGIEDQELTNRFSNIYNHVDQLMYEIKDETPIIFEFYKRARPSIDDVKEKAEAACREAKGEYKQAACDLNNGLNALSSDEQKRVIELNEILYIALGKTGSLKGLEDLHDMVNDAIETDDEQEKFRVLKAYADKLNPEPNLRDKIQNPIAVSGFVLALSTLLLGLNTDYPNKIETTLILTIGSFFLTFIIMEW